MAAYAGTAFEPTRKRRPFRGVSGLGVGIALFLLVYYAVLFVLPFARAVWLSFHNWDFIVEPIYIGSRNYERVITDDYFWQAARVTLVFSVSEIAIGLTVAFLVALGISQLRSGILQRFYLGLFYLPVVIPSIVVILLWNWMFLPTGGAVNSMLSTIGIPQQPFLESSSQALWCIVLVVVWSHLGGAAIIFFAGINDVPGDLLDAARLDGAGRWQQTFHIILPLLRPVILYQVIVSVVGTVQMFEFFYLMSGPGFSTRNLAVYTYELGFTTLNLGYGATVSMFIFVALIAATGYQFRRYLKQHAE